MGEFRDDEKDFKVTSQSGRELRIADDGWGPLWAYRESLGVLGVVRALKWHEAYELAEDSIMDDADPEDLAEYGNEETGELPEGCHYRSNGGGDHPWAMTGVAQEDLNGSSLDLLTPELAEAWGLKVEWVES